MSADMLEVPKMTVERAARALGVSRSKAYQLVRSGELPSIRIGRRVVIQAPDVANLLERSRSQTPDGD